MSYSALDIVVSRIETATKKSRIAVFRCGKPGCLESVFADTTEGLRRIRDDADLIGVYHNGMDIEMVKSELRLHVCPETEAA